MSLYDIQGFADCVNGNDLKDKLTSPVTVNGPDSLLCYAAGGKDNRPYALIPSASSIHWLQIGFGSNISFFAKFPSGFPSRTLVKTDITTGGYSSNFHLKADLQSDGSLRTHINNSSGYQEAFPPGTIQPDKWYYFSFALYINNGAGFIKSRVNNTIFTHGPADTLYSIYDEAAHMTTSLYGSDGAHFSDVVVAKNTSYINEVPKRVDYAVPVADLTSQDFTPANGGSGFEEIDNLRDDSGTTYISSDTIGHVSEFSLTQVSATDGVESIRLNVTSMAEDELGLNSLRVSLVTGLGTTVATYVPTSVAGTYTTNSASPVSVNPDTGSAFTEAEFNACKLRVEMEA